MKWVWKFFIKRREISHANTKLDFCKYHDQMSFPDVLATERCKSCDMNICYICSSPHYHYGCHIECEYHHSLGDGVVGSINRGCKTSFHWTDSPCANCGKDWVSGPEASICIACLNPTCSSECHLALQDKQICTFFKNFSPKLETYIGINGFRAIPKNNLSYVDVGQKVTFASPRFMSAVKEDSEHIMIERGFRQYGNPVETVLEKMKVKSQSPEYEHRVCTCDCEFCKKATHPVYNCLTWCFKSSSYKEKFIECWCICSECIQKGAHTQKDCHFTCKVKRHDKLT